MIREGDDASPGRLLEFRRLSVDMNVQAHLHRLQN